MPGFKKNNMGEIIFSTVDELSVADVYDLACQIGQDCEALISTVGAEPCNALIKKVIVSLELLERFAARNEQENAALAEMSDRIEKLEAEKIQRTDNRNKFEKEIESVEEQWQSESKELLTLVNRLQEENKRLQGDSTSLQGGAGRTTNAEVAVELENMQKVFRNEVENHQHEMKRREEMINVQQEELVNLQLQVESLKATNVDAKRFQRELQGQIRSLVCDRTNLMERVQDQHTEIVALKRVTATSGPAKKESSAPTGNVCANNSESRTSPDHNNDDDEEDAPVQGPMPCEPDDAPWKRRDRESESGIRKFFRQLLLEDKAPFVNRTFSSLKLGTSSTGM